MKIKNWHKFQHFKDRRPPWIKLHREILDQLDINMISDCSFRVLVGLWLLASEDEEMEGNLPTIDEISFRLRKEKQIIISSLQELSIFIEDLDISVISERYQDDVPETETETETEKHRGTLANNEFELEQQNLKTDRIPYSKIVDLYHTLLPELSKVLKLTEARKTKIRKIWKSGDIPTLDSWEKYFKHIRNSAFLMGQAQPDPKTGKAFEADLDWIINQNNMIKIIERKYHE